MDGNLGNQVKEDILIFAWKCGSPKNGIHPQNGCFFFHQKTITMDDLGLPYVLRSKLHHDFLPLAICSGIRIFFVVSFISFRQNFVRLFVGCFVAKRFATRFCHKFFRQNFVRISSELELKQRNLLTKFWRFFFVAKCCGKTFCHKENFVKTLHFDELFLVAKRFATTFCTKKIVKISSNNSVKFRQTWVEVTKSLTKFQRNSHDHFFVAKGVAKWIATRIATKSSTKALTNSQRPTDVIPFPIANHEQHQHNLCNYYM